MSDLKACDVDTFRRDFSPVWILSIEKDCKFHLHIYPASAHFPLLPSLYSSSPSGQSPQPLPGLPDLTLPSSLFPTCNRWALSTPESDPSFTQSPWWLHLTRGKSLCPPCGPLHVICPCHHSALNSHHSAPCSLCCRNRGSYVAP